MSVSVRHARSTDAGDAAAVYVSSAEHHHQLDPTLYRIPDLDAVTSRYRDRLPTTDQGAALLVGDLDGQVVGTCQVRLMPKPSGASMLKPVTVAEVDVAVLPDFRGRGVGQALVAHAEAWAKEHGAGRTMLNAHADNVDALHFYTERLAYRTIGTVLSKEL